MEIVKLQSLYAPSSNEKCFLKKEFEGLTQTQKIKNYHDWAIYLQVHI